MAEKYVPIFYDWPEATKKLMAQEKGRLIDAIVKYARGDEDWEDQIKGNEQYLFPMFQAQIDRNTARRESAAEAHRESGKLGGRPKTKQNQNNQNGFEETKTTNNKEYKEEYKNNNNNNHQDDDARASLNTVEAYASLNLQHLSPGNMQELTSFKDDLSDEVIRYGIDEACSSGAPRWAYVRRVLQSWVETGVKTVGDAKAQKEKRKPKEWRNPALDYQQRDNTGKVDEGETRIWTAEEMEALAKCSR